MQGLDLSQRVWNIKEGFYKEVETALDLALRDGTPADQLATELKQYLKHPDKLFRRVRDQHGQLHLSKRAKAFHPGQGVYRSSYKNARRLAVTETNIAYHTADHDRWKALDFVLGYEIKVSGTNPNVCPICLELQGKYPKEFKWTGWHPHCRCHAIPILEKPENFKARMEALRQGDRLPPLGAIKELPSNFSTYLAENRPRIARSRSLPFFIKDNFSLAKDGKLSYLFTKPTATLQKRPPRTPEQIKEIQKQWNERKKWSKTLGKIKEANKYLKSIGYEQIAYNDVKPLHHTLTEDRIIKRLSGGDLTRGSCSSLALSYVGNKARFNVKDFRGGVSQEVFSSARIIDEITTNCGGKVISIKDGFKSANELLSKMVEGKQYYFSAGDHAAIVRLKNGKKEFLELQEGVKSNNGFKPLDDKVLKERFGVKIARTRITSSTIVDIENLGDSEYFRKILGYINTAGSRQKKQLKGSKV